MWSNQKVMRGLALIAVALFFGVQAWTYHLGTLAKAGAGLFPLMVFVRQARRRSVAQVLAPQAG